MYVTVERKTKKSESPEIIYLIPHGDHEVPEELKENFPDGVTVVNIINPLGKNPTVESDKSYTIMTVSGEMVTEKIRVINPKYLVEGPKVGKWL